MISLIFRTLDIKNAPPMMYSILIGILCILVLVFIFKFYKENRILMAKNKELLTMYKEAERKSRLREEFIATLSQELRRPLYGIMGLTSLLAEDYPDLKDNKNIKSIKFSGDYLLTLINNVLQVNSIENNTITVQKVAFNLKETMQNLVHSFNYATDTSDNTLHFDFDTKIDSSVYGDPVVLSQILMNLISNSLKFTRNGNVYFSVQHVSASPTMTTVSFSVTHDGYDVSAEDRDSIYREFTVGERAKKTYLGTGINATIVKKLTTALQSEIVLENDKYNGSKYVFTINFENATVKEQDTPEVAPSDQENTGLRVLIVDDNKLNLFVVDKLLAKENFQCTTIDNGFDAIKLVKNYTYDLILMDINMPKLNGIGTTKKIREFNTEVPIIALTAVDVTQLNTQIIKAGLNDYILKPVDKNLLLDVISKHVAIAE